MSVARVGAFVSEQLVGLVGVGRPCDEGPKGDRFWEEFGIGRGEGAIEREGVPAVRCRYAAGCSPTSRTCSSSGFRWDIDGWNSKV
jgi:hypothetical protein